MEVGECLAYRRLQADSNIKLADCLATSWRPPGAHRLSLRGPKVNSCMWLRAVDYSTINVLCIIIALLL